MSDLSDICEETNKKVEKLVKFFEKTFPGIDYRINIRFQDRRSGDYTGIEESNNWVTSWC